jgi:hypothetical protein
MTALNLVTIDVLAEELKKRGVQGITVGLLRTLKAKRLISHVKLGHRTLRFDPDKVAEDISKLSVQPKATKSR